MKGLVCIPFAAWRQQRNYHHAANVLQHFLSKPQDRQQLSENRPTWAASNAKKSATVPIRRPGFHSKPATASFLSIHNLSTDNKAYVEYMENEIGVPSSETIKLVENHQGVVRMPIEDLRDRVDRIKEMLQLSDEELRGLFYELGTNFHLRGEERVENRLEYLIELHGSSDVARQALLAYPNLVSVPKERLERTTSFLLKEVFDGDTEKLRFEISQNPALFLQPFESIEERIERLRAFGKDPSEVFGTYMNIVHEDSFQDSLRIPSGAEEMWRRLGSEEPESDDDVFLSGNETLIQRIRFLRDSIFGGDHDAAYAEFARDPSLLQKRIEGMKPRIDFVLEIVFDGDTAAFQSAAAKFPKLCSLRAVSRFKKVRKFGIDPAPHLETVVLSSNSDFNSWIENQEEYKQWVQTQNLGIEDDPSLEGGSTNERENVENEASAVTINMGDEQETDISNKEDATVYATRSTATTEDCHRHTLINSLGASEEEAQQILDGAPNIRTRSETELKLRLGFLLMTMELKSTSELRVLVLQYPKVLYISTA